MPPDETNRGAPNMKERVGLDMGNTAVQSRQEKRARYGIPPKEAAVWNRCFNIATILKAGRWRNRRLDGTGIYCPLLSRKRACSSGDHQECSEGVGEGGVVQMQ